MAPKHQRSPPPSPSVPRHIRDSASPKRLSDAKVREHIIKRRKGNDDDGSGTPEPLHIRGWLYVQERGYGSWPDVLAHQGRDFRANVALNESSTFVLVKLDPEQFRAALAEHNLRYQGYGWLSRQVSSFGEGLYPTLVFTVWPIESASAQYTESQLQDAAQKIHGMVQEKVQHSKFLVEVEDPTRIPRCHPSNLPLEYSERVDVSELRKDIFNHARNAIGPALCGVGTYMMDSAETWDLPAHRNLSETVVVNIYEDECCDFDKLKSELKTIARAKHPRSPWPIRFLATPSPTLRKNEVDVAEQGREKKSEDENSTLTNFSLQSAGIAGKVLWEPHVTKAGGSIAPVGVPWSRTLGGFARLVKGSETKNVLMTAAHCAYDDKSAAAETYRTKGIEFGGPEPAIKIRWPSEADCLFTKKWNEEFLPTILERLAKLELKKDALDSVYYTTSLQNNTTSRDEHEAIIALMDKLADDDLAQIGKTLVASPIEILKFKEAVAGVSSQGTIFTDSETRLDWALVEMEGPLAAAHSQNLTPLICANFKSKDLPKLDKDTYMYLEGMRVSSFATIKPGDWVCFAGRTNQWAAGYINATKYETNWEQAFGLKEKSAEWDVGSDHPNDPQEFGDGGDSGAWVFNMDGQLVGVHTAGVNRRGMVTPILAVIEDIKKRTGGWELVLP